MSTVPAEAKLLNKYIVDVLKMNVALLDFRHGSDQTDDGWERE